MLLRRTVAAASLPVTLAEAKVQVRETENDEDALIGALLAAAVAAVCARSGRVLATETWAVSVPGVSGDLVLPKSPVQGVVSIGYFDAADAAAMAVVGDFYLFTDDDRAYLRPKTGKAWPITSTRDDALTVTFTAGYAVIPAALRVAVLMLTAHWFTNREAVAVAGQPVEMPDGVAALIGQERIGWAAA